MGGLFRLLLLVGFLVKFWWLILLVIAVVAAVVVARHDAELSRQNPSTPHLLLAAMGSTRRSWPATTAASTGETYQNKAYPYCYFGTRVRW
jgi:hypothetical protein